MIFCTERRMMLWVCLQMCVVCSLDFVCGVCLEVGSTEMVFWCFYGGHIFGGKMTVSFFKSSA